MADKNFDPCLAFVLAADGGYVDDPLDPGGATNLGITLKELTKWRHSAVTKQEVMNLTRDEAAAIYRAHYWNVVRGDSLPSGVDLMVFDAGVNLGVGRSARMAQAIVDVTQDGSIWASDNRGYRWRRSERHDRGARNQTVRLLSLVIQLRPFWSWLDPASDQRQETSSPDGAVNLARFSYRGRSEWPTAQESAKSI